MTMRFWVSWEEKTPDYRPLKDPPNTQVLGWWKSGEAGDGSHATICAWVAADDVEDAKAAVLEDWPGQHVWRFVNSVENHWTPGPRFPLSDWSTKRSIE